MRIFLISRKAFAIDIRRLYIDGVIFFWYFLQNRANAKVPRSKEFSIDMVIFAS